MAPASPRRDGKLNALKSSIREIPDFPKKGILFYDITTLLKDPKAFSTILEALAESYRSAGVRKVAAIEARGFIFGAPLAHQLGAGFVPIRKPGKLPADVYESTYSLEYGRNTIAVHRDAIARGERVLLVDDLLATGGTMAAAVDLVRQLGGEICGLAFLVELVGLKGRDKFKAHDILSLIQY
ncbi:MAG TPA: adenine phosphoribosyltransferase [Nitrospiria bacterium]|nr:adenine phosphoribosyltransferase [Nitrospiria bacterium]